MIGTTGGRTISPHSLGTLVVTVAVGSTVVTVVTVVSVSEVIVGCTVVGLIVVGLIVVGLDVGPAVSVSVDGSKVPPSLSVPGKKPNRCSLQAAGASTQAMAKIERKGRRISQVRSRD
ncbi:hypothetical protein [Nannocystis pusilla]|uniref:hypothetical protein n=1 Tax=Nannocystis pusilla TaxID=889268 RepID=UPI003B776D95